MAIYNAAYETEVYINDLGTITIRQEDLGELTMIVLNKDQAIWMIDQLKELISEAV